MVETPYEELDTLDHLSLREWMRRYTSDDGVFLVWEAISMLEQITSQWWEHSASENLYVRKLHYTLKRTAGYSFWPIGGWVKLWNEMADAYKALGGTLLQPASVQRVLVENRVVTGLELTGGEVIEAPEVVVSVPSGTCRACSTTASCPGTCWSGSSCCARTATAPAGSATGSRPRSR